MDGRATDGERLHGLAEGGQRAQEAGPPVYRLSMPVELWFGEHRIGVKPGTETCETFRRYANEIRREYRAAVAAVS